MPKGVVHYIRETPTPVGDAQAPVTGNPSTDDYVKRDKHDKDIESIIDAVVSLARAGLLAEKQGALTDASLFKEICILQGNSLEVCNEIKDGFVNKTCEGESSLFGCATDSSDGND